ncbi:MAG: M3 family metallopeptidase [Synechococcaceae cyanobacterium RL_1_2]|nr:M3 family metallopeptidase [Synechococcaceae cyanobacterium RL_1_2]
MSQNPLLIGSGLPPFAEIKPEHVVPAITELLTTTETALTDLEQRIEPTWDCLIDQLDRLEEKLSWAWGVVSHLLSVQNSGELRAAYEEVQPKIIEFSNRSSQSAPIYQGLVGLRHGDGWHGLDGTQQRIIEKAIEAAKLSGIGLEGSHKARFNEIQQQLAELGMKFGNNVLDATKAFKLRLTKPEEVAGLPPSALGLMAQLAQTDGMEGATPEEGPWLVTLDYPCYIPVMKYAHDRNLREKVYKAFVSKAADGEFDNREIIEKMLKLRQEQAEILGYGNYAQLSVATKMAPSVQEVEKLLEELRVVSYDRARQEWEELKTFAQNDDLQPWDVTYWAEKQKQEQFAIDEEALRPYFPLPQVLEGLFNLAQRLFDVTITAADGQAPVWHQDVRYFTVSDRASHQIIASFYLDPYSRPAEKRGGAWMNNCIDRQKLADGTRLPVAYLICNQTPPVGDQPSLMTFMDVATLFHEFGHGLQHLLTQVDYPRAAGINNIEWDAVELPSQFMENWCYDRATLMGMARHVETQAPLPEEEYQKLLAVKNYRSASGMLRQINLSLLDLELHQAYGFGDRESINDIRDRIASTTTITPPIAENNFLCAFGHIFAGGYAAGYYSYKWAEVLSADAFAAFEEVGLDQETAIEAIGHKFRDTVLALGGGRHPLDVFAQFRGRAPKTEPLLQHNGLLVTS